MLSGHSHVYQWNAPLANGVIDKNELNNPTSPWYITNGATGHYDGLDPFAKRRKETTVQLALEKKVNSTVEEEEPLPFARLRVTCFNLMDRHFHSRYL